MTTATFNGTVVADSDETIVVEGNHYFPPSSVNMEFLAKAERTTVCPWKGVASYYDLAIGDETKPNAAWCYPEPKDAAAEITGYVAFYPVVTVQP